MVMPVTFASVFGTLLLEGLFFEEAQAMSELSELVEAAQSGDSEAYDALHDTIENARPSSDGAEGAEVCLARWWSWLIRWVKEMHDSWQTRSSFG
jgi:hypothetical protein